MTLAYACGRCCQIPSNFSFDDVVAVPLGFTTAAIGFYAPRQFEGGADLVAPWREGGRGKYANQPILVIGGSSTVGQAGMSNSRSVAICSSLIGACSYSACQTVWILSHHHHRLLAQ